MPQVIGGTTYYLFDRSLVIDANGLPMPAVTSEAYATSDTGMTTPLDIRGASSQVAIAILTTSVDGITPQFLAPAIEVAVDFGAGPFVLTSSDVPDLAQAAAAAAASASVAQTSAASSATSSATSAASAATSAALRKTSILTAAAYAALTPKDANTIYFIVG